MQENKSVWMRRRDAALLCCVMVGTAVAFAAMLGTNAGCNIIINTPTPDPCAGDPCDDDNLCTTDTCVASNGVAECTNEPVDCGDMFCNPDDGECVECLTDENCDNDMFCDGAETCGADNTCAAGTNPCSADQVCLEATDECVAIECTMDSECDDGEFCNGAETCGDNGLCEDGTNPCQPDETCDEENDECVPPMVDFAVSFDNCPGSAIPSNMPETLSATISNAPEGDMLACRFTTTSGTIMIGTVGVNTVVTTDGTCEAEFTPAAGNATVTVTAFAFTDANTNGEFDNGEENEETQDTCDVEVEFTPELLCNAGGLIPDRATLGQLFVNDRLEGSASQVGYDAETFFYEWTVESQPAGSGEVTFSNQNDQDTDIRIAPPASAGQYVFSFNVTNTETGDVCSKMVTLNLLDPPTVEATDNNDPTRRNFLRGGSGSADIELRYTSGSSASIAIYDNIANDPQPEDVLATATVEGLDPDTNGLVVVTVPMTGDLEDEDPDTFMLGAVITDTVSSNPNIGAITAAEDLEFVIYTSEPWTHSPTDAVVGPPAVPAILDLTGEVGEVAGAGTDPGDVAVQGVGDGDPTMNQHTRPNAVFAGHDFNGDGVGDLGVFRDANNFDIFFGAADLVTAGGAAGTGDDWPNAPDASSGALGGALAIAIGDVNGDDRLDIVAVRADEVAVILGVDDDDDPFGGAQVRTYAAPTAGDLGDAPNSLSSVLLGDVTGDGTEDIVIGAPAFDNDGAGAEDNHGAVLVIYLDDGLPVSGEALADLTTFPAGERYVGADGQERGAVIAIGDVTGSATNDIVMAFGNLAAGGVRVIPGGDPLPGFATLSYNLANANDMGGGTLLVTGVGDIVAGSPNANKVYWVPAGTADSTDLDGDDDTFEYAGDAAGLIGTALAWLDFDGDGNNDLLVGDSVSGHVDVILGGLSDDLDAGEADQRLFTGAKAGSSISYGDVNEDGIPDLLIGDNTNDDLYMLAGLE